MKKLILSFLLGALSLTALAQTATNSDTVTIKASEPRIESPGAIRPMDPYEFDQFTGSYALSNGKTLTLFSRGLQKYAAVHGGAWHKIVATSSNSFVAVDKQLKMKFSPTDDGDMNVELTMVVGPGQLANGAEQVVTLALH